MTMVIQQSTGQPQIRRVVTLPGGNSQIINSNGQIISNANSSLASSSNSSSNNADYQQGLQDGAQIYKQAFQQGAKMGRASANNTQCGQNACSRGRCGGNGYPPFGGSPYGMQNSPYGMQAGMSPFGSQFPGSPFGMPGGGVGSPFGMQNPMLGMSPFSSPFGMPGGGVGSPFGMPGAMPGMSPFGMQAGMNPYANPYGQPPTVAGVPPFNYSMPGAGFPPAMGFGGMAMGGPNVNITNMFAPCGGMMPPPPFPYTGGGPRYV